MEARLDGQPLQLAGRVVREAVVALELGLERLEGVDDVAAGACLEVGLGGREGEVHGTSVASGGTPGARRRGARDAEAGRNGVRRAAAGVRPRMAHARAIRSIVPSGPVGSVDRSRSRSASRRSGGRVAT